MFFYSKIYTLIERTLVLNAFEAQYCSVDTVHQRSCAPALGILSDVLPSRCRATLKRMPSILLLLAHGDTCQAGTGRGTYKLQDGALQSALRTRYSRAAMTPANG
jgi:hypothetical protein